ncbi:SGNH/GDSL hydrolase family protein [Spirillospora sp. NPDC029432]|uniref:SGNH/GDSL hydrolase family protein n=1 Tax=Spirillospora sp. NPDC029432 TaxID=3154599 RepID=UPI003454891C
MRFSRAASTALGAAGLTAASLLTAPASVAAPAGEAAPVGEYAALGDSYSSGTGAGDYIDQACTRSANSFPAKWATANSPAAFAFVACGGAVIPDVRSGQLAALDAGTGLVSISIGGNDSGFASTMIVCQLFSARWCRSTLENGREYIEEELPGQLDALYGEIRSRAPRAKVVVMGYPYLYKEGGTCTGSGAMSAEKRAMINDGSDVLNAAIKARAEAAGFAFADARPAFAGHEICTADPWIDGGNVHPNAEGHAKGYLPALTAAAAA